MNVFSKMKSAIFALAVALVCTPWGTVLAQAAAEGEKQAPAQSPPMALPYIFVIVCIGLGLWLTCTPSKRADKPKAEEF